MRKKHDREALLKYIAMLKEGRSFRSISDEFGINAERLKCLWILYQTEGESVLRRKRPIKVSEKLKRQIVYLPFYYLKAIMLIFSKNKKLNTAYSITTDIFLLKFPS